MRNHLLSIALNARRNTKKDFIVVRYSLLLPKTAFHVKGYSFPVILKRQSPFRLDALATCCRHLANAAAASTAAVAAVTRPTLPHASHSPFKKSLPSAIKSRSLTIIGQNRKRQPPIPLPKSPTRSLTASLKSAHIRRRHNTIINKLGLEPVRVPAQRTAHGLARRAGFRRLVRHVSQAERAVWARVGYGARGWGARAAEVDQVEDVGDDVVGAVLAVAGAFFVVAADGVLVEVVGGC